MPAIVPYLVVAGLSYQQQQQAQSDAQHAAEQQAEINRQMIEQQERDAIRQQEELSRMQMKADQQLAMQERQAVREARMARANIINMSAASGGAGSSSEAGGLSSVTTQLGMGMAFAGQQQELDQANTRSQLQTIQENVETNRRTLPMQNRMVGFQLSSQRHQGNAQTLGMIAGAFRPK